MRISGQVLRSERRSGDFTRDNGEKVLYDLVNVRLLTDDGDVVELKIPGNKSHIGIPAKGDAVAYDVDVPNGVKLIVTAVAALV
jgi:hypothetical protein